MTGDPSPEEARTAGADDSASEAGNDAVRPVLRVVRGDASPEELAALVAVLGSLGGAPTAPPRRTPEWSRPARRHRAPVSHGSGGWRSSGLPR